jgi:hypothetical protein
MFVSRRRTAEDVVGLPEVDVDGQDRLTVSRRDGCTVLDLGRVGAGAEPLLFKSLLSTGPD